MATPCEDGWIWRDEGAGPPDADRKAHIEACPTCQARLKAYRDVVDLGRRTTESRPLDVPGFDAIRRRAEAARPWRSRPEGWWIPAGLVLAGAAAVAVVLLPGDPDPQGPLPGPGNASRSVPAPEGPAAAGRAGLFLLDASGVVLDGRPVTPGDGDVPVRPGQTVQTIGASSRIVDRQTAALILDPGTRLVVQAWAEEVVRVRLEEGRVACDVQHRGPGQTFEVRTSWGAVQVVGTRFAVTSDAHRGMQVEVFDGRVSVWNPEGAGVASVGAGESFRLGPPLVQATAPLPKTPGAAARAVRPAPASDASSNVAPGLRTPTATPEQLRQMLSTGRTGDAVEEIARALAAASPAQRPRLLALLGDAHRLAGRFDQARKGYEAALAGDGKDAPEGVYPDLADLLERDLGRQAEAAEVWKSYLALHPSGRYASRALWTLGSLPADASATEESTVLLQRIVTDFPSSPEALPAFVKGGRDLLDRGRMEPAEDWFQGGLESRSRPLREAAVVGLMTLAYRRHDAARVRKLGALHAREFPQGTRRDEVQRLLDGMGEAR